MGALRSGLGVLLLSTGVVVTSCSGDDGNTLGTCAPGTSMACTGPQGCQGFALCAADGSGWGACDCGSIGGCLSAGECAAGEVCDPSTGQCTDSLACETHEDCGAAAYCRSDGTCAPTGSGTACDSDEDCVPPEECTGGYCGCGGALYGADNVPPNVLIVQDRSGSMNDDIGGGTKWEIAQQAIADMLAAHGDSIYFGLMLYPGTNQSGSQGSDCGPGAVFIDPAPSTAGDINAFLAGASTTSFGTPTAEALDILPDYPGLEDTERSNYVLLITDGQSTCNDPIASVTALRNETPEIQTFVVGFGSGVDPAELDAMAQAGGTAQPQSPYYYQADDAASLAAAFASIAGSVFSCSYALSTTPPDPNQLYVYLDDQEVPQDPADGWTYDPATNQLTFHGASCDALTSGDVSQLLISYGCPLPEIR